MPKVTPDVDLLAISISLSHLDLFHCPVERKLRAVTVAQQLSQMGGQTKREGDEEREREGQQEQRGVWEKTSFVLNETEDPFGSEQLVEPLLASTK